MSKKFKTMAKANKPKPTQPQPAVPADSANFSVTVDANGHPLIQWNVISDKPTHAYGVLRKVDDIEVGIPAWVSGYPSFNTPKQGAFLDTFPDCNPPLNYSTQRRPNSGDSVTYRFWMSLGDAQTHDIVYGGPTTITLP